MDGVKLQRQISRRQFAGTQLWTVLLLTFVVALLTRDVWLLLRHPVAVGLDGYYYVLQVESLSNTGTLFFGNSTPLVIYLLSALKFFVDDTVVGIKLGALLFHVAIAAGVYAILESLTRSKLHAMCGTLIVVASSVHLFMLSEYVANAGGLAFLVWGVYFTLRTAQAGKMLWKFSAIICLLCAGLSHRSLAFMIAALAIVCLIYYSMTAAELGHNLRLWAGAIGLALFISPVVLSTQTFVVLPSVVRDSLLIWPQFPVARVAILEKLLLLVCSLLFLFIKFKKKSRTQHLTHLALGTLVMLSLLLTINPFLDRSRGWLSASERISALGYVQLALLLPGLFWLQSRSFRQRWLCPLTAMVFAALSLAMPLPHGLRDDYLLDQANLLDELTEKRRSLSGLQRVIAPHGKQFLITYALGVPAQQRVREGEDPAMAHWMIQRLDAGDLTSVEGVVVLSEERSIYLVPDKHLDAWLRVRPIKEAFELTKANPHLMDRIISGTGSYRVSIK